jgi:hypothetical protein
MYTANLSNGSALRTDARIVGRGALRVHLRGRGWVRPGTHRLNLRHHSLITNGAMEPLFEVEASRYRSPELKGIVLSRPYTAPNLGRRTVLTFPLFPPPQKNWSPPFDSSPETWIPWGMSILSRTSPVRGSTRRRSISRRSAVRRLGRTRQRVTPRPRRTSGGTGTTTTAPRPRLTRNGSRCPTLEKPPSERATQRRKHDRGPSRPLDRRAQAVMMRAPSRPSAWPNDCAWPPRRSSRSWPLLMGRGGSPMDRLCSSGHRAPLSGMVTMYLLMSAFHSPPWLKPDLRPAHHPEPPPSEGSVRPSRTPDGVGKPARPILKPPQARR